MANVAVRKLIADAGLRHWEVAAAAGISDSTLCVWLRKPLTEERLKRVNTAIEKLKAERGG